MVAAGVGQVMISRHTEKGGSLYSSLRFSLALGPCANDLRVFISRHECDKESGP